MQKETPLVSPTYGVGQLVPFFTIGLTYSADLAPPLPLRLKVTKNRPANWWGRPTWDRSR